MELVEPEALVEQRPPKECSGWLCGGHSNMSSCLVLWIFRISVVTWTNWKHLSADDPPFSVYTNRPAILGHAVFYLCLYGLCFYVNKPFELLSSMRSISFGNNYAISKKQLGITLTKARLPNLRNYTGRDHVLSPSGSQRPF